MKKYLNQKTKNLHDMVVSNNHYIISVLFLFFISLSIKQNDLFLKELAITGFIILASLIYHNSNNITNNKNN